MPRETHCSSRGLKIKTDIFCPLQNRQTLLYYQYNQTTENIMLKRSKYSPRYRTIEQARAWAYDQEFDDVWYLIHNIEEDKYQLVNDSRLYYLQHCWVLHMDILETWE